MNRDQEDIRELYTTLQDKLRDEYDETMKQFER